MSESKGIVAIAILKTKTAVLSELYSTTNSPTALLSYTKLKRVLAF